MLPSSSLQPVKAESLSAQVADTIREAIFREELQPGQVLRELGLAKTMNVSQATVREALAQLETYGLVVRTPNRGTTVTNLSLQEVRDRMRVRLALECLAFVDAGRLATEEQFEALEPLVARIGDAKRADDYLALLAADREFHLKVWELANNPVLFRSLDRLTVSLFAFRKLWNDQYGHSPAIVQAHADLLQALRARDKDDIIQAVRNHLEGVTIGSVATEAHAVHAAAEGSA